jgi:hypothetical protein
VERYESAVERQIREAQERGEFDDLPGRDKPLPGLDSDDELWWVRGYLRREGVTADDLLPEGLQLRKQLDRLDRTVAELPTEQAVREHVELLNTQIRRARLAPSGPPVMLRLARVDEVVDRWRAARPAPPPALRAPTPAEPATSWWSRLTGRRRRTGLEIAAGLGAVLAGHEEGLVGHFVSRIFWLFQLIAGSAGSRRITVRAE